MVSIKGVDDMVSIKGVDNMVPKATGKAQFLVIFCMYSFSLGHDGSPISGRCIRKKPGCGRPVPSAAAPCGGRHQIGTPAGFGSEQVAGFILECMAGFVGIRTQAPCRAFPCPMD
jgi:hypothetical protein